MKKLIFVIIFLTTVFAAFAADGSEISLAVLVPEGRGLNAGQSYLPAMVQGVFVSDLAKYSNMRVLDRQNLDKVLAETESGIYQDEANLLQFGQTANVNHALTGVLTKTSSGFVLQVQIVPTTAAGGAVTKASYSGTCTVEELDNFTAIKKATLDLLTQLGLPVPTRARTELAGAANMQTVNAQTSLAKGITAQKSGTVVESLAYYFEAVNYDANLTEALNRLNILQADISSGSMGENIRNDFRWRDQWVERLKEAEKFYADYVAQPTPYYLVYGTDLQEGETDYTTKTVPVSFTLDLLPSAPWVSTLVSVVNTVSNGLLSTGRSAAWKFDWPNRPVAVAADLRPEWIDHKPFIDRDEKLVVAAELINDEGTIIGRETFTLQGGWRLTTNSGNYQDSYASRPLRIKPQRMSGPALRPEGRTNREKAIFTKVDPYLITDKLTIRIASINGVDADTAARTQRINIVTESEYARLPEVIAKKDIRGAIESSFKVADNGALVDYSGYSKDVVIPSADILGFPIIGIGDRALMNIELTSVTIPNSVTSIGAEAFRSNRLTSVTIPDSVTSIGFKAFQYNKLTSITIPDSVTSIGTEAFSNNLLTSVTIPNGVTTISSGAFESNQLTSVTIPDGVTSIGDRAFRSNRLTSVTIPNSVTGIGFLAFEDNKLTGITIPTSVTGIAFNAFYGNLLTSITLPANAQDAVTSFLSSLGEFYKKNGKKAGTYSRPNAQNAYSRNWSYKP